MSGIDPDPTGSKKPREDACDCAAADPEHPHTADDHRHDCGGWPPCGGCYGCIAMTVTRWERP